MDTDIEKKEKRDRHVLDKILNQFYAKTLDICMLYKFTSCLLFLSLSKVRKIKIFTHIFHYRKINKRV